MLEGKLMFGATPIRRDGPVGVAENEWTATNQTIDTTMNSSVNNSVRSSPTKSPGRRDDDGVGMRIATFLDDMLPHQSARSHTSESVTSTGMHSAREPRPLRSGSPGVGLRSRSPGTLEQQQARNAQARIAYPGEARDEFAKRISESAKDKGLQRVVGLHVPLSTGLRVKPVDGGTTFLNEYCSTHH